MLSLMAESNLFFKVFGFIESIFSKLFGSFAGSIISRIFIVFLFAMILGGITGLIVKNCFAKKQEIRAKKLERFGEVRGSSLREMKRILGRPDFTMPIGNGQKVCLWGAIALIFDSNNICLGYQNNFN